MFVVSEEQAAATRWVRAFSLVQRRSAAAAPASVAGQLTAGASKAISSDINRLAKYTVTGAKVRAEQFRRVFVG
jgi:hypothetical protein